MWNEKVVIITGSSIGIGRSLAFEIGKKGAKIVLNARNEDRMNKTYEEFKTNGFELTACSGDVSKYEDCVKIIEHTISTYGKIDILINNAGISAEGTLEETKPDVFKQIMEVNFLGSVYMTRAALPYIKQTRGSILFVGSLAGIHGLGNYSAYCSSKMALTAVVESLRKEVHGTGTHIGIAYVGFTENDPEKTYFDNNGHVKALPVREKIKQVSVKKTVLQLMRMIEKRKYKSAFTPLGKLNAILNRISPYIVHNILLRVYRKNRN